jgi:hypothetical protein
MGKVYSNSYCNIAATAAKDSHGGLFFPRNPLDVHTASVDVFRSDHRYGGHYTLVSDMMWKTQLLATPLLKRAWVYQERLLAPRTLHFTTKQIIWECNSEMMCEMYPNGLTLGFSSGLFPKPDTSKSQTMTIAEEPSRQTRYRAWRQTVHGYSRCHLTKPHDKLVALTAVSKLASSYQGETDTFLAGLWRNDLPQALTWYYEYDMSNVQEVVRPENIEGHRGPGLPLMAPYQRTLIWETLLLRSWT